MATPLVPTAPVHPPVVSAELAESSDQSHYVERLYLGCRTDMADGESEEEAFAAVWAGCGHDQSDGPDWRRNPGALA